MNLENDADQFDAFERRTQEHKNSFTLQFGALHTIMDLEYLGIVSTEQLCRENWACSDQNLSLQEEQVNGRKSWRLQQDPI